ncbi:MAG: hypothetical protein LBS74_01295 [Oscillospiraceae bacterium]|jgi:hypothetical protein|nr:hypothetical protein [Oscillospiraceae bacterium]
MKKISKIASIVLAIALLVSMASFGLNVSAATATTYTSSEGQSSLKSVSQTGATLSGTYNIYGWPTNADVYVGNVIASAPSPTGTKAYTATVTAGTWPQATDTQFSLALTDGGASTSGYTVIYKSSNGNWAAAYIPYEGPKYEIDIKKNGTKITTDSISLWQGAVSGYSLTYLGGTTSDAVTATPNDVVTITKTGLNFTVTPLKAGTATVNFKGNDVTDNIVTFTVTDDSTVVAQWFATGQDINNGSTFTAAAGKAYGFGVDAFPATQNVVVSVVSGPATITQSSVSGQYPYSVKSTTPNSSAVIKIQGATKSIQFTVNFTDLVFDFFTDSNSANVAEPLVQVPVNGEVTIYTNKPVTNWALEGTGVTKVSNTTTSITLKGITVDTITKITASDASGQLGWFDAYVIGEAPVDDFFFVAFKIGSAVSYRSKNPGEPSAIAAEAVIFDGRAYAVVLDVAAALGLRTGWDEATSTVTIRDDNYMAYVNYETAAVTIRNRSSDNSIKETYDLASDQYFKSIDGRTYAPARALVELAQKFGNSDYRAYSEERGGATYILFTSQSLNGKDALKEAIYAEAIPYL